MELLLAGGSVVSLGPHEHALAHVRKLELWALMMKPLLINQSAPLSLGRTAGQSCDAPV